MRGVAEAHGAITFVTALPTGTGAAAAISLSTRVTAEVERPTRGRPGDVRAPDRPGTPLLAACARAALAHRAPAEAWSVDLRVESEIPIGRGLKSSSSVGGATVLAVAEALGRSIPRLEAARISSRVAREIGLSATGAFDDACAALLGGCVVTDNSSDRILRRLPLPSEMGVALWIPSHEHTPSPGWLDRFRERAGDAEAAVAAALDGDLVEAMRRNTSLVEERMGYEYRELHRRGSALGAVVSGVSGLGPTVAFLAPTSELARLYDGLPREGAEVRLARLEPPVRSASEAS